MSLVIKNGTIVTSKDVYRGDIRIDNEVIAEIKDSIEPVDGEKVIDANGQYIFPGGLDSHVHFGVPGYADDFESGTKAAAVGGITTIVNFMEPPLKGKNLMENFEMWKDMAKNSYIDYGLHPIINGEYIEEAINTLSTFAENGVTSIKLFMSARAIGLFVSDAQLYEILKKVAENNMIATVHCENGDVIDAIVKDTLAKGNTSTVHHAYSRPTSLESEATRRILAIAEVTGANIRIAHVSCEEAMLEVERAQKRGVKAVAETCAHYLTKDITDLDKEFEYSSKFICSPPLREKWNQDALWKGLNDNILSTMGSDHAPVPYKGGKTLGRDNFSKIPNGGPGVEDMFSIVYHYGVHEKRISLQKFVEIISTNTAKQMGLGDKKGDIRVGYDADIVILDPNKSRTISVETQYQKCDYNAYEGTTVQGVITHVLSRGEEIVTKGVFNAEVGRGRYLNRKTIEL